MAQNARRQAGAGPVKANQYNFKVTPEEVEKALRTLEAYIAERVVAVEKKMVQDPSAAVKFQAAIADFAKSVADRVKSPAEALHDIIRFTMIPNLFDNHDIDSIAVAGVGKCRLQDDIQCKVVDKEALYKWLTENELEDIITETVNAQTLAAHLRKRIKANTDAVEAAMKKGITEPEELQKTQKPMPPQDIMEIKPIVRSQITRE